MTYLPDGLCGLIFLLIIGELLRKRFRAARYVAMAALLGLFLWSWPPSTALFEGTLERWYSFGGFPVGEAGAIVVLSASAYSPDASQPEVLPGYGTFVRCRYAAWLYRNWKPLPIVVSGGMDHQKAVLADVMRQTLESDGVPSQMIWTEGASRTTYESALFTARLLRAKSIRRIVLVTEAYHMPRSVLCFRKQGLDVIQAGCAARYLQFKGRWTQFFPSARMIGYNEESLHEWIGLAWYRLSGKI
jgi:uncharacterized SAM-binding protein YcdF (DUF218 family)